MWVMTMAMVLVVLFVVVLVGFFLDLPPKLEKVVDRARKSKRAIGMVAIDFLSFVQEVLEKRVM